MRNTIKILVCFLTTSLLLSFDMMRQDRQQSIHDENNELVLRLEPGPDNPRNSEGSFITLKDGRILFIYSHFTGTSSAGDNGSAHLAGRYSGDGGKTWGKKSKLIVEKEGVKNIMSASLLRLKNGDITLFYLRKNSISDCIPMIRVSKDEAKTWSDPVACITDKQGYFVLNNDRVIQLENGRLIMAVSLHKTPEDPLFSQKGKIYSYYSDDHGQSWKTSGRQIPNPGDILLQEPGLVELKNGNLMMFIRTDMGVQYMSYSKDKGETWSPAEPSTIVSPRSPASIERIPSTNDLLMVWNNNGSDRKRRTPLNIAVSKDEGNTWEKMKTIEDDPDGGYCYTAIHFTDKHVLLAYCAGSQSKGTRLTVTNISRLGLDWIYK